LIAFYSISSHHYIHRGSKVKGSFDRLAENDQSAGLPFNFSEPIKLVTENCTKLEGKCSEESLDLWKLDQGCLQR
jgi:hypothetical protein